ncbi:MAG: DEAD/DEAH box helicase [Planctomycetota bacterium]
MLPLPAAVLAMHRPPADPATRERARRRVALREAAALMGEVRARRARRATRAAPRVVVDEALALRIAARLPFTPSPDQARAIAEIHADLASGRPMARLLQGDVGTGKTLVALAAALAVTARGHKAVLLAPTEILAEQHAARFARDLAGSRLPVRLHSASVPARVRRETEALLASPGPALVVGTHALLGADLRVRDLGLLVIDEQQRFGVAQRARLWRPEDGRWPHALVMSATPIPRTLATALFGDLDCSELRLPPTTRRPVTTEVLAPTAWPALVGRIAEECAGGGRVFVVCPRIGAEDDEDGDGDDTGPEDGDEGAVGTWRELSALFPAALVHGRQKPAERREAQHAFRDGALGCLVGTTLLEVGIDVPEATWMVVRDADRLGLATLHQLRGRVGRGDRPARCFLVGDPANERLQRLAEHHDGFAIAELDLAYRGAGELGGARQHGRWRFRCLDPFRDHDLLGLAGGEVPAAGGSEPSPAREAAL